MDSNLDHLSKVYMRDEYIYRFNIKQYQKIARFIEKYTNNNLGQLIIYEIGSRDAADAFFLLTASRKKIIVHCFDPHPLFLKLGEGFKKMSNSLLLHNYAISNIEGQIDFYRTDTESTNEICEDWGIGASSLKKPYSGIKGLPTNGYKKISVCSRTGKDVCADLGIPSVIILDVQGAELDTLKSFGNLINNVKLVFCEVNIRKNLLYSEDTSAGELIDWMAKSGFKVINTYNVSKFSADLVFFRSNNNIIDILNRFNLFLVSRIKKYIK